MIINRNYKTAEKIGYGFNAIHLAGWAESHNTDLAVAVAIHAISEPTTGRTPDEIWESPKRSEYDHICMAINEYLICGDFDYPVDGYFWWGEAQIHISDSAE